MKRLLLLAVLVVAATAIPAQASAAGPCRNDIYDDWYQDGKIASTYPISCYRDAIKHVHGDAQIYSSLTDDIRAAMQAAISRAHGKSNVPNQVGKGVPASEHRPARRAAGRIRAATRRTGRTLPSTSRRSRPHRSPTAAAAVACPCRCSCSVVSRSCSQPPAVSACSPAAAATRPAPSRRAARGA